MGMLVLNSSSEMNIYDQDFPQKKPDNQTTKRVITILLFAHEIKKRILTLQYQLQSSPPKKNTIEFTVNSKNMYFPIQL